MAGIEDPRETVRRVVAGGADAVIFNAGMAGTLYPEYGNRCGSVFNLTNVITGENDLTLISSVEYALKQAADAISVQVMVGSPTSGTCSTTSARWPRSASAGASPCWP